MKRELRTVADVRLAQSEGWLIECRPPHHLSWGASFFNDARYLDSQIAYWLDRGAYRATHPTQEADK